MPAYVIVDVAVRDSASYQRYKALAPPAIAAHGGRYLARGGRTEVLEGVWSPERAVILEFPTLEKARAWWASAEYAEGKALRQSCARTNMIVVEGLSSGAG
jgi:uncharacterized protein (DUF1330 family)